MVPVRLPRPTDAELGILRVLWSRGAATVREVHDELLSRGGSGGYTTTLKLMQIMADKGLVERDESERAHVYKPRLSQERTQQQLVSDLAERAFGGSPVQLAMKALASKPTSREELAELRKLLDALDPTGGES